MTAILQRPILNSEIASCKPPLLPEFWLSSGVQSRERSERTQPLPAVAALFHSSDVRTFLSLPESAQELLHLKLRTKWQLNLGIQVYFKEGAEPGSEYLKSNHTSFM